MSEYRLKIGVFARMGPLWPRISGTKRHLTNHSSCRKTSIIVRSCCIKMRAQISFRFVAMIAFDRQTDRRTEMSWKYRALHYMQLHGKN